MALTTIISGGQTGADQGGLAAGEALGLRTGGWIPKGWKTEKGPMPELERLGSGGLKEHASSDYPPRTKDNVAASDGTLLFGDKSSRGARLTIRVAKELGLPLFVMPWKAGGGRPGWSTRQAEFRKWLSDNHIQVLNVAGNRESGQPGIFDVTRDFIVQALTSPAPAKPKKKKATTKRKKSASSRSPRKERKERKGKSPLYRSGEGTDWEHLGKQESADHRTLWETKVGTNVLEVYPVNPLGAAWAATALGAEEAEEQTAVQGIDFGLLSRVKPDKVISFARKIKRSGMGYPFPVELLSSRNVAEPMGDDGEPATVRVTRILAASGGVTDPFGASISPLTNNDFLGDSALEGILLFIIAYRIWNRTQRDWGGQLIFRLPEPRMVATGQDGEGSEEDVTKGEAFATYLCGEDLDSCPSKAFLAALKRAAESLKRRGGGAYREEELKMAYVETNEELVEIIDDMMRKIGNLRIGFYDPEGRKRVFAEPDYYGADKTLRRIGSYRRSLRKLMEFGQTGELEKEDLGQEPQTFAELKELAEERDDQEALALMALVEGETGVGGMSASLYKEMDDKAILKLEDKLWRARKVVRKEKKERKKKIYSVLPLLPYIVKEEDGELIRRPVEADPLMSIAFTLYWCDPKKLTLNEEGELDWSVVWPFQIMGRVVYTKEEARELIEIVRAGSHPKHGGRRKEVYDLAVEEAQGAEIFFNPMAALRMAALQAMGTKELNEAWEAKGGEDGPLPGGPPLRAVLVATATVNTGTRKGFASAQSWAKTGTSGLRKPGVVYEGTEGVGVYFSSIDIPTQERTSFIQPDAWQSAWGKKNDPEGLVTYVVQQGAVDLTVTDLAGLEIQPNGNIVKPPLAGRAHLFSFANVSQTDGFAWSYDFLEAKAIAEERDLGAILVPAAYYRAVGTGSSGRYGSAKEGRERIEGGRAGFMEFGGTQVSRRARGRGEREVGKAGATKTIFSYALTVCRVPDSTCNSLSPRTGQVTREDIEATMKKLGIKGRGGKAATAGDEVALRKLAKILKAQLEGDYYVHTADLGDLPMTPILDSLALPNRGRRNRRPPRKPRRGRRSERNPLPNDEAAVAYAQRGKDRKELEEQFERLQRTDPASWPISETGIRQLFPSQGSSQAWGIAKRFPTLTQYDLASRVGPLPPLSASEGARYEKDLREFPFPFSFPLGADQIAKGAGLSIDEAAKILGAQRKKRLSPRTMQPSSAICKNQRTRKLKGYYPPNEFLAQPRVEDSRDLFIWLSPKGFLPRVMSIRRGVHIDCDMVGKGTREMPDKFAQAMQSALYWLVEKPKRMNRTSIWVGRVGEKVFYNAWSGRGEWGVDSEEGPITLNRVLKNLQERDQTMADFGATEKKEDINQYRGAFVENGLTSEEMGAVKVELGDVYAPDIEGEKKPPEA